LKEKEGEVEQVGLSAELDRKFVMFGKGSRQCIGRDIAMRVVEHAVREILAKWEVQTMSELKGKSWLEMQYDECWIQLSERGR
jgi:benzoate 4-monooxygenase